MTRPTRPLPIDELARDLRYAARSLKRSPVYTLVVVLTLGVGIGAAATAQGVIDPLLLRPLAFAQPERLVTLDASVLPGEYALLRERVASFEALTLYRPGVAWGLAGTGEAERVTGARVTPDFFATLGVPPLRGSVADAAEQAAGAVVLSHALWVGRFGADLAIIGGTVRLDGRELPVVAVMPADFAFPARSQLWHVQPLDPGDAASFWGHGGARVVGRLRAAATSAHAESEVRGLSAELSAANPLWTPAADYRAQTRVLPLHTAITGDVRTPLLLLGGAVALLLLIACANVANLVLARGLDRAREMAVRTALGASSAHIVRQLLAETLVLAMAGGALGVALALGAAGALRRMLPAQLPRAAEIGLDARVLAATVALTFVIGLVLAVLPARRAGRQRLQPLLREGGRTTGDRASRRLSGALVVAQVGLAVLLVTGAALLVRSLGALQRVDTGIGRLDAVTVRLDLPAARYASSDARRAFHERVLASVAALPGVRGAALSSQLPFSGEYQASAMAIEHVTTDPNQLPMLVHRRVTPAFFEVLGIPLQRGRAFDDADAASGLPVAIVDETAARLFWGGQDPIGRRLGRPWLNEMLVVVGVVGAVLDGELAGAPEPTVYTLLAQEPVASTFLVVDAATGPGVLPSLRTSLRALEPDVPLSSAGTLRSLIGAQLEAQRLATLLLALFGATALLLAGIGIYGVLAYAVGQRSREFAVRLALGATARDVATSVLRDGGRLAGAGALLGIAAALLLGRLLTGVLYGVSPRDPVSLLAVTTLVLAAAAAAACVPARRASRTAPMQAMKE